jgi:hypothetical protein
MKKPIILAVVLAIILTAILSLAMVSSKGNYVKIAGHTHSFTKAICDSKNLCQDYEIFCKDLEVIKMNPITGAVVQFSESWKDPRTLEQRNEFC